jgi:preprotein translocase subunit SecA
MLKRFVKIVGGDPQQKELESYTDIINSINDLEPQYEALSDQQLAAKTEEFKRRLRDGETLDDLLIEAFAVVRETSKRTIGLRHYDVQLIGGIVLHHGKIAEMRTGEGKTLVATLPIYLNSLTGRGVHLVTVNDYLARRDARWMGPIFNFLGLKVGVLQMAARTESGRKGYIVNLKKESPHEDQHQLDIVSRKESYRADVTYGTNSEYGFDYLRDNMAMRLEDRVQRGHYFTIIDEVDNILIDEARTPLIISGPAQDETEWYQRTAQVVKRLNPEDFEINEKDRSVFLSEVGEAHVEELLGINLRDPDRPEDITLEQARMLGYLEQSLRAQFLYRRNKEYLVQSGKVVIIDEFTGRLMPGRRWSDGLHQAVEAKEGVKIQNESVTYATVTIQNYFRMYEKLAGMTGTAVTEAEEFKEIYDLDVLAIPTNLDYQAVDEASEIIAQEDKDESGYRFTYYSRKEDQESKPIFWKRKDYPDVIYRTQEAKLRAIAQEIMRDHIAGRPVLVGTTSVELSDLLSNRLRAEPIRRLAQVLLLRDSWMKINNLEADGRQIDELEYLNAPLQTLDISAMRMLARETGISFNPQEDQNINSLLRMLNLPENCAERLTNVLKGGVSHEVLNARKHTEESQIIAGAGAFGAVTIATNMAGRGVDIKLGGEIAEEVITAVSRVLKRAGYAEPYGMTMQERRDALIQIDESDYGIYDTEIKYFIRSMQEMQQVRELGGLHVIGSERHEARRIDNQLRGRSARQGDPGSSRFYLSMEDELMRLFGGQQADSLMKRMKIDDAMPLEMNLVGRIVEQSQSRVEGANFDVRKHLLEYDDVLNTQRESIYSQRERIFRKTDLTEDALDMLKKEVARHIPEDPAEEFDGWRLISWLDQIQPSINVGDDLYPSYVMKVLSDHIQSQLPDDPKPGDLFEPLNQLVRHSVEAEQAHNLDIIQQQLFNTWTNMEIQLDERMEAVDMFLDASANLDEDESGTISNQEIQAELSSLARTPIKLSNSQLKDFLEDPYIIREEIKDEIESNLASLNRKRVIAMVDRRVNTSLEMDVKNPELSEWEVFSDLILEQVANIFQQRMQQYLGPDGQVSKDIEKSISQINGTDRKLIVRILLTLPQGAKAVFDSKTHKRVWQRTTRFTYVYHTGNLIQNRERHELSPEVFEHLEGAQHFLVYAWGRSEFKRLASYKTADFEEPLQHLALELAEKSNLNLDLNKPLQDLDTDSVDLLTSAMGRFALSGVYRQLMLSVISELWIEYLTQMEALRVSIGLEAYAQRDPLVQYKNRAFGLYQELVENMRMSVANRMFTFRPRSSSTVEALADQEGSESGNGYKMKDVEAEKPPTDIKDRIKSGPEERPQPEASSMQQKPRTGASKSAKRRQRRKKK